MGSVPVYLVGVDGGRSCDIQTKVSPGGLNTPAINNDYQSTCTLTHVCVCVCVRVREIESVGGCTRVSECCRIKGVSLHTVILD